MGDFLADRVEGIGDSGRFLTEIGGFLVVRPGYCVLQKGGPMRGSDVVWTIVGILAIIALLFYVIPKMH